MSLAIIDAYHEASMDGAGILVNSSTGKDSTLMVGLFIENALARRKAGKNLTPAIIGISDTGSEFPGMKQRMEREARKLRVFATKYNLPLKVNLVRPPAKNRLLVELLGGGIALPQLKSGGSASGFVGATWCMDRVKRTPLSMILKESSKEFPFFIQCIGVRSAESTKRASTIDKYSKDFPFGLTELGGEKCSLRMGGTPIAHWEDQWLRGWMMNEVVPWDYSSSENLNMIYSLGSKDSELMGECAINLTKEGAVTNTCSDLSGARFGCWMCLLSTNKSLKNAADKDDRYKPLRDFHAYLFSHHQRGDDRRIMRKEGGFNDMTLFPKSFTLNERIVMLMRLMRAEIESGFTLLEPEDLVAIEAKWHRSGLFSYTADDAREDTERWMQESPDEDPRPFFHNMSALAHTSIDFSEGLPFGAYNAILHPEQRRLELNHLIATAGWGTPLFPTLQAYVFTDLSDPERLLVMVSDHPSAIGSRTNTGLLNGLVAARWTLAGTRSVTDWERRVSDGRVVFYECHLARVGVELEKFKAKGLPTVHPLLQSYYANTQLLFNGCEEDYMGVYHENMNEAIRSAQELTFNSLTAISQLVTDLVYQSEFLTDDAIQARHKMKQFIEGKHELLEARSEMGKSKEAKKFRKQLRAFITAELDLPKQWDDVRSYIKNLRKLTMILSRNNLSPALVNRLAFIARMSAIDPDDAERSYAELAQHTRSAEVTVIAA